MTTQTRSFDVTLGGEPAIVFAPRVGTFDPAALNLYLPDGATYGFDVEGTWMHEARGQFDPDFKTYLNQFATTGFAWVLTLADPVQRAAAQQLLVRPRTTFCSHTSMDVLSTWVTFGIDMSTRNMDTRMLARLINARSKGPAAYDRSLKALVSEFLGPELREAEQELEELFRAMWAASGGKANAGADTISAYGWNNVDHDNEIYLKYAGLDAIACRRLLPILLQECRQPRHIIETEQWLTSQAIGIQIRGMRVDEVALKELHDEAVQETTEADAIIQEATTGWTWTRPNTKGEMVSTVQKKGVTARSAKALNTWLGEHGVDWASWPGKETKGGAPSLAKENVKLLLDYPLDDEAKKVAAELIRFKAHQDALNKTNGILDHVVDGRLHPELHTIGTNTHRMSSTKPNFQNFSKKDPRMRGLVIPEDDEVFMTADFDQVELRVAAALAPEPRMIEVIMAGGDLHDLTVDLVKERGVDLAERFGGGDEGAARARDVAKMTNFLIVYGGGGYALHTQADLPRELADEIVRIYKEQYQGIKAYTDYMSRFKTEFWTVTGRRLLVPVDDYTGETKPYANINYMVQSSARDLLVDAWWRLANDFGRRQAVQFPVHDELMLRVPKNQIEEYTADIERCMRFDFMGVPISASAVVLRDREGVSRWMTAKLAEKILKERLLAATAA